MAEPFTLRPATVDDFELVHALRRDGFAVYVEASLGPWDDAVEREVFRAGFVPERTQIVEVGGDAAGVLELVADAGAMRVKTIVIDAARRGGGLGAAVMRRVLADHARVILRVLKVNERARRFYERLGFHVVGESERHWWELAHPGREPAVARALHGLQGGVHGGRLTPGEWAAIDALYDRVWPTMPARLRHAERLGARWAEHTTPFTWFEHGRALATAGVLCHPVRLAGDDVAIAGFHAVCTDPDARGRGLCRAVMRAAVDWAEPRYPLMKLSTATPEVYRSAGFAVRPTYRFAPAPTPGAPVAMRRLNLDDPDDLALVRDRLATRAVASDVFGTRDPGWLSIIDAAIARVTSSWFYELPELDAVLVADRTDDGWRVDDLIARELPARLPALGAPVTLQLTPDRLAPDARLLPEPIEELMVRGPWPDLPPFAVPALWEH